MEKHENSCQATIQTLVEEYNYVIRISARHNDMLKIEKQCFMYMINVTKSKKLWFNGDNQITKSLKVFTRNIHFCCIRKTFIKND